MVITAIEKLVYIFQFVSYNEMFWFEQSSILWPWTHKLDQSSGDK
jgi:hypothetical protein